MSEREIFEKATQIQDVNERRVFLENACGQDLELRDRLNNSLASYDQASRILNAPTDEQLDQLDETALLQTVDLPQTNQKTETSPNRQEDDDSLDAKELTFLEPSSQKGSLGRLGHYEILEVLGHGSFGIVFKAFDEKLHRYVAVKTMSPQIAATSPPRKRFLREARSAAAINHENVVRVYSVEEHPIPYLVMEYVDGLTLQQRLDGAGPLDELEILHLGRQMAAGLAAAHNTGLIHRDIKPGNILIEAGAEEKLKITDFGLARAADDATISRTGTIAGTPMYMAPEQAMGQSLDHRTDLFSLGSILYQMTCGRPPFRGPTAMAVLKRVVDESPRPIKEILPEAPEWLCSIIEKLHAKNPDERFHSAKEVADLLTRCQNELRNLGEVTCVQRQEVSMNRDSHRKTHASTSKSHTNQISNKLSKNLVLVFGGIATTIAIIAALLMYRGEKDSDRSDVQGQTTELALKDPKSNTDRASWPTDAPPTAMSPFDSEHAKKHQEAWANYLKVPIEYTNSIGIKFCLIPPGEFPMGITQEQADTMAALFPQDSHWTTMCLSAAPQHTVRLTKAFYMGACEVTQEQYMNVANTNPSYYAASGEGKDLLRDLDTMQHPVETVSFNDAAYFCIKLSEKDKLKPSYVSDNSEIKLRPGEGYRLPTEAEWEWACRAGDTTLWICGENDDLLETFAWINSNSEERTHAIGKLKSNAFGLYDTIGNVWEWCQDWHDARAYSDREADITVDPQGPETGSVRVFRGGDWNANSIFCRTAFRDAANSGARIGPRRGFRLALDVEAVRKALTEKN